MNKTTFPEDIHDYATIKVASNGISEGLQDDELKRKRDRATTLSYCWAPVLGSYVVKGYASTAVEVSETYVLSTQLAELKRTNSRLQKRVLNLEKQLQELREDRAIEKAIILRKVTKQEARREIQELFTSTNETLYYSNIAERLSLDLELVVEICRELREKGEIAVDEQAL